MMYCCCVVYVVILCWGGDVCVYLFLMLVICGIGFLI